jgi:nucleotide-binding universal stress UspA family protein
MKDRTVVCWNGSTAADTAVEWAVRRALRTGGRIELFDIVDTSQFIGEPLRLKRASDMEEERLEERRYDLADDNPGLELESHLQAGDPLALLSEQTRPDTLVVVGTAGRVRPHFTYGWSMGAKLAVTAAGPVAIVPAESPEAASTRSGVTVGVDGSPIGQRALGFAATEAATLKQRLKVVHCWQEPLAEDPLVTPSEDFISYHEAVHQELLDYHVQMAQAAHPDLQVVPMLLRMNPLAGLSSESADELMLVVGSRRLTGWRRAWLGSVSHGLVLALRAPTVVVGAETSSGK